jgi:hypothetical protein
VFVRVQHIDGTLEPAASIGDHSELVEEVGTTFTLDDGRVVQVIGHEREIDGSVRYVIVGELPEPRVYSATGHEAYVRDPGEWAMGSEQYGTLMLNGSPLDVGDEVEAESPLWSPDGRYLAATVRSSEITRSASGRRQMGTEVVVIDAESREVVGRSEKRSGYASPLWFVGRSLVYADDEGPWAYPRF